MRSIKGENLGYGWVWWERENDSEIFPGRCIGQAYGWEKTKKAPQS